MIAVLVAIVVDAVIVIPTIIIEKPRKGPGGRKEALSLSLP